MQCQFAQAALAVWPTCSYVGRHPMSAVGMAIRYMDHVSAALRPYLRQLAVQRICNPLTQFINDAPACIVTTRHSHIAYPTKQRSSRRTCDEARSKHAV